MKDNKKADKEMKKQKKKSSPFFANLNVDSSIEYGFAETNPKSKKVKWVIGGFLLAAATVGISVPWAMSSCVVALNKPYNSKDVMYTYYDPIQNKVVAVTYDEYAKRVENTKVNINVFNKWDDIFYESVLENLYNEEREAFNKFKAIYYKVHKNKNPEIANFGSDLSSTFDDIKNQQTKTLYENKKQFEKVGPNWLNEWLKELQSNSIYGMQQIESGLTVSSIPSLEKKAIAYLTVQQIKNSSLARYQGAAISSNSWDYTDYEFANTINAGTEEYTKYISNDGTEKVISKKDAVDIWKAYLTKGLNVVQPKDITPTNNKKIAVFETKSYVTTYRNPIQSNNLVDLINNNFKLGLLSSVSIADIKPGEKNADAFNINQDVLKKLFTIQNTNTQEAVANFIPFSQLNKYQGASTINTSTNLNATEAIQNTKDALLSKTFNTEDKTMGSSKVTDALSLVYKDSALDFFGLSAFTSSDNGVSSTTDKSSLFSVYSETGTNGTQTTNTDPISKFMTILFTVVSNNNQLNLASHTTVQQNWNNLSYGSLTASSTLVDFVKLLNENLDATNFTFKSSSMSATSFNTALATRVDSLSPADLTFMGKLLNCILIGDTSKIKSNYKNNISNLQQVGYWTLYKLNTNSYMYINTDGIKIFSKRFADFTLDDYKKMVMSDLNNTINAAADATNLYYDVASIFKKLNDDNLIIKTLLADTTNVTKFKDGIKKQLESEGNPTTNVDEIYNNFYAYVISRGLKTQNELLFNTISALQTSLDTIINGKRTYDFATYNDSTSGEDYLIFQTKNKYGSNSVIKQKSGVEEIFIQNIENIFSPKITTSKRKVK